MMLVAFIGKTFCQDYYQENKNQKPVNGKTVYAQQFTPVSGYVFKTISVSQLAKGVYVLRFTNSNQKKVVNLAEE
jgi:hypothetical protein